MQFGVQQGGGGVEVNLVVAPPEANVEQTHPAPTPEAQQKEQEEVIQVPEKEAMVSPASLKPAKVRGGGGTGAVTQYNPNYFQNPAPPYPDLAKQMRQQGLVTLVVSVDREGRPSQVEIERSSGYSLLDQSALEAVRGWKFQPARIGGLAIESKVRVPIRFHLEE